MKNKIWIGMALFTLVSCQKGDADLIAGGGNESGGGGKGGSMARFAVHGTTLYTVNFRDLVAFDISNPGKPVQQSVTHVGFDVETIFPYGNTVFLGAQSGMYIYDISNPVTPAFVSHYEHVVSCDPVVVDGQYAYVTLSTSTTGRCFRGTNRLEVIDVSNPSSPVLKKVYSMTNPKGLGIDQNTLFVCDEGLKVFDANDPLALTQTHHFNTIQATDVIPLGDRLLVVGDGGFYQYSYLNGTVQLLSKIPVEK